MKYVLDANVFITASRFYYSFDFGSKFWDFILDNAKKGKIVSIDKVYEEIRRGNDELKNWAEEKFRDYFISTQSDEVMKAYAEIVNWAIKQRNKYKSEAIDKFMEEHNADAWLVAFAKAYNYILVTHEKSAPEIKVSIPIPQVCKDFEIQCIDTFSMLRALNFRI